MPSFTLVYITLNKLKIVAHIYPLKIQYDRNLDRLFQNLIFILTLILRKGEILRRILITIDF
ncbi:hypothetical protein AK95_19630 [Paenibacillus sp. LC231]|nr:hypothetical protein AK95_19630 [Paenibacillus sp. LC231]